MKEIRITLLMISVPPGEPLFPLAIARIPPNLPKAGSQNQENICARARGRVDRV